MCTPAQHRPAAPLEDVSPLPPLRWHLVWCHKRCFQRKEDRDLFGQAARRTGGTLLCFNKAAKFLQWLASRLEEASNAYEPYALLTDSLEVERIMLAPELLQQGPTESLLLCEEPHAYRKASLFVRGSSAPADSISLHREVSSVLWRLADMSLHRFIGSMNAMSTPDLAPKIQWSVTDNESLVLIFPRLVGQPWVVPVNLKVLKFLAAEAPAAVTRILMYALPEIYEE